MTQEEKIKLAREWYNDPSATEKEKSHLEQLFPELKESKDERIKTNIIKLIRFVRDTYHQYSDECNEAIDWLEKQSEQKSQGKSALEVWKDMRLEVYQQASGNRHEPNYSDDSTKIFSLTDIDEIFEKVVEKQGEQKPIKPVTVIESDDERIRNEIISFLKEGEPYYCPNSVRRQEWVTWFEKQGELVNSLSKGLDRVHKRINELIREKNKLYLNYEALEHCLATANGEFKGKM